MLKPQENDSSAFMTDVPHEQLTEYRENLWRVGQEIVLAAPQLFIDVDVEADGIAGHGSLLSIGAQSPTGASFYRELKPAFEEYKPANRQFCENHNLQRERLLREGEDPWQAMSDFHVWLDGLQQDHGRKPVFTAFNAGFDWALVDLYFVKAGYDTNPFGIAPFDIKSLAIALTGEWDWAKTTKGSLPEIIVPPEEFTHNALEDAQWQQKLHFGVAALLGAKKHRELTG